MMNVFLKTLHLEADHLALCLDEALHNPLVSEDEFFSKIARYNMVLRRIKRIRQARVTPPRDRPQRRDYDVMPLPYLASVPMSAASVPAMATQILLPVSAFVALM